MNKIADLLKLLFGRPSGDDMPFSAQPPAMVEAMRQARESLPVFWEWLESNQDTDANRGLKVAFETRRGTVEYIWLVDIRRTEFFISGIVSNQPRDVPSLKEGEIFPVVDLNRVVDWTLEQDGLFYGGFTSRVLAAVDPSREANMTSMSESPLPPVVTLH